MDNPDFEKALTANPDVSGVSSDPTGAASSVSGNGLECAGGAGWQPISTAPKDGEPVLIWKPDERMVGEYMMAAYWADDHYSGGSGWVPVGGAHLQGYVSTVTGTPQGHPTHWMPLPAAPTLTNGGPHEEN